MVIKMERVPSQPVKDPLNLVRACPFDLDRLLSHLDPGPAEESEAYIRLIYEQRRSDLSSKRNGKTSVSTTSLAVLTSPPNATARLVVDTDVASFIFKWHPVFAPRYVSIIRGAELIVSFMTLAEMRQGALDANWGQRKWDLLEAYLADFSVLNSDNLLCSTWAQVRNESVRKGRQMSAADAWIAATALVLSAPLVTNNAKDYRRLGNLQLVSAAG